MIDDLILKRSEYLRHSVTVANDDNIISQVIDYYSSRGWDYGDAICDRFNGEDAVNLIFTREKWNEEREGDNLVFERIEY